MLNTEAALGTSSATQQALLGQEQQAMQAPAAKFNQVADSPRPAPPEQQKIPAAPQASQFGVDAQNWTIAMSVLSGVVGAFSRQHATTALNAFSAGIKGYQDGNKTAFDEAHKTWEENTKAAIENNKILTDKYKEVLEDRNLSEQEQVQKINLIAAQYHDPLMSNAKDISLMAKIYESQLKAAQHAEEITMRMQEHRDLFDYKEQSKDREKKTPSISQEAADFAADQLLAGDKSALSNYGRGEKATANLALIHETVQRRAKEKGITGDKLAHINALFTGEVAEQRAMATRSAPAKIAVKEMDKLAQPMVDAFKALDPTQYPDLNSIQNAVQNKTGSPKVVKAALALQEFKTAFTNLMVRNGVPTDQARSRADELFNLNFNIDQIEAVRDQAKISGAAVLDAITEAREGSQKTPGAAPSNTKTIGGVTYQKDGDDWYPVNGR